MSLKLKNKREGSNGCLVTFGVNTDTSSTYPNHHVMLQKLFGISKLVLIWVSDYISNQSY